MIGRGRVLRGERAEAAVPLRSTLPEPKPPTLGRIVPKQVVDASQKAQAILAEARGQAHALLAAAERKAADLRLRAETEARAEAASKLAAQALALATHEARSDERALDRSIALARLLAERLLGASLAVAPEQIVALARQALSEARGARRLAIVAHPEDARLLEQSIASLGVAPETVRIAPDAGRSRGSLRIETEIGVLDADLAPQLDRLALRLRESLADGE
jgi:flagellar biosynthesis/type III secretory pathway protein FliH